MPPEPLELLRALADDDRLRVVGMLALRPRDATDLSLLLGITESALDHHLRILERAGLVRRTGGVCALDSRPFRAVMAATAAPRATASIVHNEATPSERKVLDSFFRDERLEAIPSQRKKLLIVLRALASQFAPGRWYPEREVNEVLKRHHPDVATLRRAMVDEGMFERERGRYRRL